MIVARGRQPGDRVGEPGAPRPSDPRARRGPPSPTSSIASRDRGRWRADGRARRSPRAARRGRSPAAAAIGRHPPRLDREVGVRAGLPAPADRSAQSPRRRTAAAPRSSAGTLRSARSARRAAAPRPIAAACSAASRSPRQRGAHRALPAKASLVEGAGVSLSSIASSSAIHVVPVAEPQIGLEQRRTGTGRGTAGGRSGSPSRSPRGISRSASSTSDDVDWAEGCSGRGAPPASGPCRSARRMAPRRIGLRLDVRPTWRPATCPW